MDALRCALLRTISQGNVSAVIGDATLAYRAVDPNRGSWTPGLSNAVRSVVMDKASGLTLVYDWATSATPRQWELNFHCAQRLRGRIPPRCAPSTAPPRSAWIAMGRR